MLQPPALIDPLRHDPLPHPRQVGRMIHPHLHPPSPKLLHQRRQQRSTARPRRLPRAPQRIGQDAERQPFIFPHRLPQRLEQLPLRLANVQRRQENARLGAADACLERLVELGRGLEDLDLVALEVEAGRDAVEFSGEGGKHACGGAGGHPVGEGGV